MTDFHGGNIIIAKHFAVKVTRTGRGWFAEVADSQHPKVRREAWKPFI